jgi:hypothetical protein
MSVVEYSIAKNIRFRIFKSCLGTTTFNTVTLSKMTVGLSTVSLIIVSIRTVIIIYLVKWVNF